jgi:hypothetical protein
MTIAGNLGFPFGHMGYTSIPVGINVIHLTRMHQFFFWWAVQGLNL